MPVTALDERTALVLIDLQAGILRLPISPPAAEVIANAKRLVEAFHTRKWPVVFVHVNELFSTRTDQPLPPIVLSDDFDAFPPELSPAHGDLVVTKHGPDAFYGTDLDVLLRRRGITNIVLGGVSASRGVESTARSAQVRAYNVTFAKDAMADGHAPSYEHSVNIVFPRLGEVDTTSAIVKFVTG